MVSTETEVITFTLNGAPVSVRADHPHLLAALREELDVTSPKDGCSPSGQCGCCTILLDGKAVVACQLALRRVEGKSVTTLEGVAEEERDRYAALLRRDGRAAVRFLHAGHRDADEGARRQEGCRPGTVRRGAPSRRAPLPVHGLREDPRRDGTRRAR